MTNNPTRKRAQTSYGRIEYNTLQCAECTNETVTTDLTHIYCVRTQGLNHTTDPEDLIAYPICVGCVREFYGYEGDVLITLDQLADYYDEADTANDRYGIQPTKEPPRWSADFPTQHGSVEMEVANCTRCDGEWVAEELGTVHIPMTRHDDFLWTEMVAFCPDCRELYISAFGHPTRRVLSDVLENGLIQASRSVERGAGPPTPRRFYGSSLLMVFTGGILFSIIFAAISPLLGAVVFLLTILMVGMAAVDGLSAQKLYEDEYGDGGD